MRTISKRERILLYAAMAVIATLVAYNSFLGPFLRHDAILSRDIMAAERRLRNYRALLAHKDELKRQFNAAFASVPILSAAKESSLVAALSEIERIAGESGVQIIDLRPQGFSQGTALYREAAIDVRAEGTLAGYMKFIYNTEHSLSLLRIRKFQLTARRNSAALDGAFSLSLAATSE